LHLPRFLQGRTASDAGCCTGRGLFYCIHQFLQDAFAMIGSHRVHLPDAMLLTG
jgi:hypothetical protein